MSHSMTQTDSGRTLRVRGRIVAAGLILLAIVLVARLVQLQLVEGGRWRRMAASAQERTIELPPRRGTIRDRDGTLLAFDVKAKAIAVDGIHATNPDALAQILAEELGLTTVEASALVRRESYFTWVDRSVELETAQRIEARARDAGAYGLILLDTWKRCYPQGRLASNVIGFVGTDGAGLEGIELSLDETLRGRPARLHVVEGADGRTYQTEIVDPGEPGCDVVLTLDADLQFICEGEIERAADRFQAAAGMIVAVDPATGDVLAMAQDKGYDLNRFATSSLDERRNLAVSSLFEPGSVFKVFAGLAALEADVIAVDDLLDGDDGIDVGGHVMHNSEHVSYGTVTFAEMIEHSINTAMIRVVLRLGKNGLHDTLARFGFGEQTGVELPGEEAGILRPPADWTTVDLAAASIGQSVAVTGIQLARALAAIAHDGFLPTVHVVRDEADAEGATQAVDAASASSMRGMMIQVVESGTGILAGVDGFAVAGKTGTAQKAIPGRGYVDGMTTSLFAGFLPADDPQIVILVVLDEVTSGSESGGYTAAPVFREVVARMIHAERLVPSVAGIAETRIDVGATDGEPAPSSGEMLFGRH